MQKIPVIQKVGQLLSDAIKINASDIHFEVYEIEFRVRYRLDGALKTIENLPYIQKEEILSRIKIMADLDIAEKRKPQDGKISFKHHGSDIDIRVSVLPTRFGEKIVLRLLNRESIRLSLESLGLNDEEMKLIDRYIRLPYGMILVTGPTGSGKTTSLYSVLNDINHENINITTIEDPIEYSLTGINQTHIREEIGFTFASSLRSILRQDPDVIMIGEMRDSETADIAIRASLTGHLVFSTLHTNDAPSTLIRLIHLGIEPFLISSSVRLIIAQRLVRKLCPNCKTPETNTERYQQFMNIDNHTTYYKAKGCEICHNTGHIGRTAIFEILPVTEEISELILKNASVKDIRETATKTGMNNLLESALIKAGKGIISLDEIMKKVYYKPELH